MQSNGGLMEGNGGLLGIGLTAVWLGSGLMGGGLIVIALWVILKLSGVGVPWPWQNERAR